MDSDNPSAYETSVQREMINQARRCARLEIALELIRVKLEVYLPAVEGEGKDELHRLIERIDRALEERT